MTIIEAIKSGKRFRRKGEKDWYYNDPECFMSGIQKEFSSDDWEVEEKKVTITSDQFDKAVSKATVGWLQAEKDPFLSAIKRELGL